MEDTVQLASMAGVALMVVIPFVAYLVRQNRRQAVSDERDESDRRTHARIEEDIKDIRRKQGIDSDRLSAIEGELKRMNGKH